MTAAARDFYGRWPGLASIALTATLSVAPGIAASTEVDVAPDVAVKAALLFNFAKFVEWPALPTGAPLVVCFVGSDAIAAAFVETVRGQTIGGHRLDSSVLQDSAKGRACHVLFIANTNAGGLAGGLAEINALPILTVSDGKGFSMAGGIIELYVEAGRMRFAINLDAADRSGLRLSSRLLGLAKVIRNGDVR